MDSVLGVQNLGWFVVSGLLLNMTPGPDSILVMTRSAAQGWRAGSAAALGVGAGTLVHVLAAALGLSALIATSAAAFAVLKLVGAAYLVYLGCSFWRARPAPTRAVTVPPQPHRAIFAQGFWSNALNPKVALFFMAFVPQFIDPQFEHKALSFLVLGGVFCVNSLLWSHLLALTSAAAGRRVALNATVKTWLERGIGALFVSFGVKLALADAQR